MNRLFFLLLFLLFSASIAKAQFIKESKVFGNFESNSQYYFNDNTLGFNQPTQPFSTNNYLKLIYQYKFIEAGLQYENYLPPLLGYSAKLEGHRLASKYLTFRFESQQITFGNFYEQFGSGLVFKTYEDRALGINTAIDGVNWSLNWQQYLSLKILGGKQLGYKKDGTAIILGADAVISLSEILFPGKNVDLNTEFGWAGRYYDKEDPDWIQGDTTTIEAFTCGLNFSAGNWHFSGEWVTKSKNPSQVNGPENKKGMALLINPSFTKKGVGVNLIARRLKRMDFRSENGLTDQFFLLNYLPANTKQHKYSLANLYPYAAQPRNEWSWQADVYFLFPKQTVFGGKYGTKIAVNYSQQFENAFAVNSSFSELFKPENMVYRDFNVEIDKKWSRKMKTVFSYIGLNMENYFLIPDYDIQKSNIVVADILYKIKPTKSVRVELQHLWADLSDKNWMAFSAEYAVAPRWSVFFSDMANYRGLKIHYPNGGVQLNIKSTSLQVNYGRNREGFKCSGGICRWMPAYSGVGFSLTTNF